MLTLAGKIFERFESAPTISGLWHEVRAEQQVRPVAYGWFILAIDLLFLMQLVWLDQSMSPSTMPKGKR